MITRLATIVSVTELVTAVPWYQAVLGRPPDRVVGDGRVEWDVLPGASVQVEQSTSAEAGGHRVELVLVVEDLEALVADLREHDIATDASTRPSHQFRTATVTDPDGNRVTLVEDLVDGSGSAAGDARGW